MFVGHVINRFSTVFANLNMTQIINGLEITNSDMTQIVIM